MKRNLTRALQGALFLLILLTTLTSCLSTDVTVDVRDDDAMSLSFVYTIPRAVWDLGVFDHGSPERAVPVSERDARETAGLYPDVTLEEYVLRENEEQVRVEVVYAVASVESLAGLWGRTAGRSLTLNRGDGTLVLPLGEGVDTVDPDQEELIAEAFRGREFSVTVRVPGTPDALQVQLPDGPEGSVEVDTSAGSATWTAPMAEVLLNRAPPVLSVTWSQ